MRLFFIFIALSIGNFALATEWLAYPSQLQTFDYSGDKLKQNWPKLTQGTQQQWPDEAFIGAIANQYPDLLTQMLRLAQQPDAHPAVKALLEDNYSPLAQALQQTWRLHYEGKYEQSYQLGAQLGPAGAVPAIYSKLIHTTFLVKDPKQKRERFRQAAQEAETSLQLTPGYDFGEFGLLYARARILELLDASEALSSGYLGSTQARLEELAERHPNNSLYPTTYAGIQAGVVERVGSFIGRVTYGATAKRAIEGFKQALELEDDLPVIYNEFIVALERIDPKKHQTLIQDLSAYCLALRVYSAEEALNQAQCDHVYKTQQQVEN